MYVYLYALIHTIVVVNVPGPQTQFDTLLISVTSVATEDAYVSTRLNILKSIKFLFLH